MYRNGRMSFWSNLINSKAQRVLRYFFHFSVSFYLSLSVPIRSDICYAFIKSLNVRSLVDIQWSDSVKTWIVFCHQILYNILSVPSQISNLFIKSTKWNRNNANKDSLYLYPQYFVHVFRHKRTTHIHRNTLTRRREQSTMLSYQTSNRCRRGRKKAKKL